MLPRKCNRVPVCFYRPDEYNPRCPCQPSEQPRCHVAGAHRHADLTNVGMISNKKTVFHNSGMQNGTCYKYTLACPDMPNKANESKCGCQCDCATTTVQPVNCRLAALLAVMPGKDTIHRRTVYKDLNHAVWLPNAGLPDVSSVLHGHVT